MHTHEVAVERAARHRWRERYAVAGDTKADRSKRRGLGVQQLRSSAALLIEWVTICHRQGWLGEPVLNERNESVPSRDEAESYCTRILSARHALGLTGVPAEQMLDHQAEGAAAYSGAGKFAAASAYGADIVLDIDGLDPDEDELVEEHDD